MLSRLVVGYTHAVVCSKAVVSGLSVSIRIHFLPVDPSMSHITIRLPAGTSLSTSVHVIQLSEVMISGTSRRHTSRPILRVLVLLDLGPLLRGGSPRAVLDAVRDSHVPLQQVLPDKVALGERRANRAREWFAAPVTTLVPLALVLAQEAHSAGNPHEQLFMSSTSRE